VFKQIASYHLQGSGCSKCSSRAQRTTQSFIEKAKEVHGDRYDYSLVDYKDNNSKIEVICKKHGAFITYPNNHLSGKNCAKCSRVFKHTTQSFIERAKEIHGDKYNYSLVNYINSKTKIKIICHKHGEFLQEPANHLQGSGCDKCAHEESGVRRRRTIEQFMTTAKKVHGDRYDYSKVDCVHVQSEVVIICKIHGEFKQNVVSHLIGNGCFKCNKSLGENKISYFLKKYNIDYDSQKRFDKCKNKKTLPFDFYIKDKNLLIEYDGQTHYMPVRFGGISIERAEKNFEEYKKNDEIKTKFSEENNIKLLRIPYTEFENIEKILKIELNIS
jgi:hypothetical protein